MKTSNSESVKNILNEFVLTNEEMIQIRGGEGDPVTNPSLPPVKI